MSVEKNFELKNTPKSEKYKTNTLLLLMNGEFEKNMLVDICDMAQILQAAGFKLEKLSKNNNFVSENKDDNMFKITLTCGRSRLQAVYTKHDYVCNCLEDLEVEEINTKAEIPRFFGRPPKVDLSNEEYKTPMGPKVQEDWEVDPKTTPPMRTSSPISTFSDQTTVCTFCSEKDKKLTEYVTEMKLKAEQILELLPKKNNTFTKKTFKRVSDIPKTPNSKPNESFDLKTTVKRSTPKKTPRKIKMDSKVINETNLISPKRSLLSKFKEDEWNPQVIQDRRSSIGTPYYTRSPQLKNDLLNRQTPNIKRRNSIGTTSFSQKSPQVVKNQILSPHNLKSPGNLQQVARSPLVGTQIRSPLAGKSPQISSPLASKSPAGMSLYLQPPPKSQFTVKSLRSPQIPVRSLKSPQISKSKGSPLVERNNLVSKQQLGVVKPQLGVVKPLKSLASKIKSPSCQSKKSPTDDPKLTVAPSSSVKRTGSMNLNVASALAKKRIIPTLTRTQSLKKK